MSHDQPTRLSRRALLQGTGASVLSAAAISLLAGIRIANAASSAEDVRILNVALALEHEAINCYQLGAQTGLLQQPLLDVVMKFQGHHKTHRDTLISTIQTLGGTPVMASPIDEYAKSLKVHILKTQGDVIALAAKLELAATNAYLGVIPSFKDSNLAKVAGRLAAEETSHWAYLNDNLGYSPPAKALTFGA
jgi:rubrerythrin